MPGRVVFAWRRVTPPFLIGGAEVSQRLLAEQFVAGGWEVTYLGAHEPPWNAPGDLPAMLTRLAQDGEHYELDRHDVLRYSWRGVNCIAAPQTRIEPLLDVLLAGVRPDLVITAQEGADMIGTAAGAQTRVAGWLHSVSKTGLAVLRGQPAFALATSRFVLEAAAYPRALLFYPPFAPFHRPERPVTGDLLMVNPVPAKGAELVRELAELLPERHFTLVEGWWNTATEFELPNVTYVRRTDAMDALYAGHQALLVPSTVPDAFPRVIIEAALAGLPTLGSNVGGIPEALGPGGFLLPPDNPTCWAEAIKSLTSPQLRQLGCGAFEHALSFTRPCLPELIAEGLIDG